MTDTKISALASATTPAGTEVVPIVQAAITKKTTLASIAALNDTAIASNTSLITHQPEAIRVSLTDEITTITAGVAKVTFRMPFALTLTSVRASLTTESSLGIPTVDINESGTTVLSTKLTIDAGEKTSTTAAVPAVISDSALADDAEITFDIDVAGTGAAGLKVWLIGTRA